MILIKKSGHRSLIVSVLVALIAIGTLLLASCSKTDPAEVISEVEVVNSLSKLITLTDESSGSELIVQVSAKSEELLADYSAESFRFTPQPEEDMEQGFYTPEAIEDDDFSTEDHIDSDPILMDFEIVEANLSEDYTGFTIEFIGESSESTAERSSAIGWSTITSSRDFARVKARYGYYNIDVKIQTKGCSACYWVTRASTSDLDYPECIKAGKRGSYRSRVKFETGKKVSIYFTNSSSTYYSWSCP